jgi:hypothetical protein
MFFGKRQASGKKKKIKKFEFFKYSNWKRRSFKKRNRKFLIFKYKSGKSETSGKKRDKIFNFQILKL